MTMRSRLSTADLVGTRLKISHSIPAARSFVAIRAAGRRSPSPGSKGPPPSARSLPTTMLASRLFSMAIMVVFDPCCRHNQASPERSIRHSDTLVYALPIVMCVFAQDQSSMGSNLLLSPSGTALCEDEGRSSSSKTNGRLLGGLFL